jgi:hypothetical protein
VKETNEDDEEPGRGADVSGHEKAEDSNEAGHARSHLLLCQVPRHLH